MSDLAKAQEVAAASKAAAARECASGKGKRCDGTMATADKDDAYMWALQVRADRQKPVAVQSDYLQAAKLLAVMTGGAEKAIEAKLALFVPFLLALICEIGAITFGNLAVEHRQLPSPPTVQALTFERPLTTQETDELKATLKITAKEVNDLLAKGMKQHQVAAMYGVNQGRISELLSGKRESVEV
jgi:hypothetical protein